MAPLITGPSGGAGSATSAISVYEEQTAVTKLKSDETVTWSLVSGDDSTRFSIGSDGTLTFNSAGPLPQSGPRPNEPDYESPTDTDANNTYVVTVQAKDTSNNTSTQTITVTVLNVDETKPRFTSTNANDSGSPSYSFSYAEGTASGTTLGSVSATGGTGTLSYRITGGNTDNYYTIDTATGAISLTATGAAAAVNDFEQGSNVQTLTVEVSDSASPTANTASITVKLNETNVSDNAPIITGPSGGAGAANSAISVPEEQTAATRLTANKSVTWLITGGDDAGKFSIAADGTITFVNAPDYEAPSDTGTNNTYVLTVLARDADGVGATQTVTVTVTDIDDTAPVITGPTGGAGAAASAVTVKENQTGATKLSANETVTWSIIGGSDANKFSIASDGTITFKLAPDFEAPTDSDGNNTYVLIVQARDAAGNLATQTVTVTVVNVDDSAPLITGPSGGPGAAASEITVKENQTGVTRLTANEPVTWSIVGGTEESRFTIAPDGTITFKMAPDYEGPTDSDRNNTYVLIVQARDADGNISTQTITVTVANVDDTAPVISGPGGDPGAANAAISVPEGQPRVTQLFANETVSWLIVGGPDAAQLTIEADGTIRFLNAPDFENPTDADRNNSYVIQVRAMDLVGNYSIQTITITITDIDEVSKKLAAISGKLRGDLRRYAFAGLHDMLSFNEGMMQTADQTGDCSAAIQRKDLSGRVQANQQAQNVDLQYQQQLNACEAKVRVFLDLGLSSSSLEGSTTLRSHGAIRAETTLRRGTTLGIGVVGSLASDSLGSFKDSSISDKSLQANLYLRTRLGEALRAGAFGSIGRAWYDFSLTDDGLAVAGRMTGERYAYGAMLSGDLNLAGIKVTTDLALSRASEQLDHATLTAAYQGEYRRGVGLAVGTVDATRLSVPVHMRLVSQEPKDGLADAFSLMFSPGLLCEDQSADVSALTCGYQIGGKFNWAASLRERAYLDARHESVNGNRRNIFSIGYVHAFGPVELGMSVDREMAAFGADANRAMVHLKFVGR